MHNELLILSRESQENYCNQQIVKYGFRISASMVWWEFSFFGPQSEAEGHKWAKLK